MSLFKRLNENEAIKIVPKTFYSNL